MATKELVFISCGQATQEEKRLGSEVCQLVSELTQYRPYFAENQASLEGLTQNILGNLNRAIGLIAIMHPRGVVRLHDGTEGIRGSVWIEQELAIAAFIEQVLNRKIKVAAYIHKDIRREGMRDQLLLSPIRFSTDSDVVEHLRNVLPDWCVARDPTAENRWNLVREELSKLPEYNRQAVRLLLDYGSLTDYTGLQKLGQMARQNSLASVLPDFKTRRV